MACYIHFHFLSHLYMCRMTYSAPVHCSIVRSEKLTTLTTVGHTLCYRWPPFIHSCHMTLPLTFISYGCTLCISLDHAVVTVLQYLCTPDQYQLTNELDKDTHHLPCHAHLAISGAETRRKCIAGVQCPAPWLIHKPHGT